MALKSSQREWIYPSGNRELVKILEKEQFQNNNLAVVYLANQRKREGIKMRSQRSTQERAPSRRSGMVEWH